MNAAPPADPPPTAWTIVASPNISGRDNRLLGVAAVSVNDVWAVGNSATLITVTPSASWTLTTHWNGTSWSEVPSTGPGQHNILTGVAAQAANDIWAVGSFDTGSSTTAQGLILHWNGSAWSQVSSPNVSPSTYFYAVTARASNDAWAVGSTGAAMTIGGAMVIAHWDGSSWNLVTNLPSSGSNANMLTGVAALAANDAWAVGYYYLNTRFYTLLEHWNGSTWSIVPGPNLGTGVDGYLQSVAMVATNDVWAVGQTYANSHYASFTLHWDGTAWSQVFSPSPDLKDFLSGVAAAGPNEIWAVGRSDQGGTPDIWQTLTLHKDTPFWGWTSSPNPPQATYSQLDGVAAVGVANSWAVGSYHVAQGPWQTLIEHYTGSTPTPTNTPTITPTATPISTPPTYTVSYYIGQTSTEAAKLLGCKVRDRNVQGIVVLDFGVVYDFASSDNGSHIYGTQLPSVAIPILLWPPPSGGSGGDSLPTNDIYDDVLAFAKGYALGCDASPTLNPNMNLTMAIGANNSWLQSPDGTKHPDPYLTSDHGRNWAMMVAAVNDELSWLGYLPKIRAAGAYDAEPRWSWKWDYNPTYQWAKGYSTYADSSIWHAPLFDFGSCDGCVRIQPRNSWSTTQIKELQQVADLSWRLPGTRALPEIYKLPYAEEWYNVRRLVDEGGKWMDIAGVMTECGDVGSGCDFHNPALWVDSQFNCQQNGPGTPIPCNDFPPSQGWQALHDIHNASCTPDYLIYPLSLPLQCSPSFTPNNIPPPHIDNLTDILPQPTATPAQ